MSLSLNFDSYGRLPDDPDYDGSQLGSMELYNLKIQKLKDVFTDYDAVTKKYVDGKIDDLLNGAGTAYDTLREIEKVINGTDQNVVGGMLKEIADLSGAVATEKTRAEGIEGGLATRIATLESDPTTGASVTAVQNEVDRIEAGAGLSTDGNYTPNPSSNYLSLASSLKDADDKLDAQLKSEVGRATAAESTNATNLSNHITTYETDHKQNDQDKNDIGQRITDLTTENISEDPLNLYYTDQRVKNASVHSYEYFNAERQYDAPVEVSVETAFSAIKTELQGIHSKEDTDDTRHGDLTVSLNTVAGTVTTERSRAIGAENALSGRVEVFEEGLNNGNVPGSEYYVENLSVQGVVDDLRGAIDYVNGERATNSNNIAGLADDKYDKEGGAISGDATFEAKINLRGEANFENNVNLQVQHANQDETINGTGKYLYFSDKWRMYGKSDGSRLVFEYNSGTQETANWKSAVPFISSI